MLTAPKGEITQIPALNVLTLEIVFLSSGDDYCTNEGYKRGTSTPVNIVVVHATQRASGVTMRTRPNMVRRTLGPVHMATV